MFLSDFYEATRFVNRNSPAGVFFFVSYDLVGVCDSAWVRILHVYEVGAGAKIRWGVRWERNGYFVRFKWYALLLTLFVFTAN